MSREKRSKKAFYESAARFSAGAMRHLDLRVPEARDGTHGGRRAFDRRFSVQATEAMLVSIAAAVVRCS